MLLFGGWLALLSACAQLLSLAGLFLVDAKHLGTAQGAVLYGGPCSCLSDPFRLGLV